MHIVVFYQLSSEHHEGGKLLLRNASGGVAVHGMQTEDRLPDAAPTAAVVLAGGARGVEVTGLFAYYAANVSSAAAVEVGEGCSGSVAVFRQWHSYHPLFYNCSVLAEGGGGACVAATDFAYVGVE